MKNWLNKVLVLLGLKKEQPKPLLGVVLPQKEKKCDCGTCCEK
jgi:hypothetical protein